MIIGIEFDEWDVPVVDEPTLMSTRDGVFFGGDSAFGPKNIIWAVAHGHEAAISIHKHCQGEDSRIRLPRGVNLSSQKMGMHEWSYSNDYDPGERRLMPHVDLQERFKNIDIEVELGLRRNKSSGSRALPELRYPDSIQRKTVHRVRCLSRYLPGQLPDDDGKRRRG